MPPTMPLTMPWTEDSHAGSLLSQVRDVPLAHLVRDEILASILRGEFSPGERITEPTIASRLGVSRVPVREALRDLEHMGLVESKKHAGVLVRQLSTRETRDLYQLRSVLDAFAGREAAAKADPALLALLEQRLAGMDAAVQARDVMAYYESNLHFHWDIIHASGNREICGIYRGVVQKLHMARLRNLSTDVGILNSIKEHHAIVDAIRNKRADICEALMASHVKAAGERLHKILFEGEKHEEKTGP